MARRYPITIKRSRKKPVQTVVQKLQLQFGRFADRLAEETHTFWSELNLWQPQPQLLAYFTVPKTAPEPLLSVWGALSENLNEKLWFTFVPAARPEKVVEKPQATTKKKLKRGRKKRKSQPLVWLKPMLLTVYGSVYQLLRWRERQARRAMVVVSAIAMKTRVSVETALTGLQRTINTTARHMTNSVRTFAIGVASSARNVQQSIFTRASLLAAAVVRVLRPVRGRGRPKKKFKKLRRAKHQAETALQPVQRSIRSFPWSTVFSLLITLSILLGSYWAYDFALRDLPSAQDLVAHKPIVSTKILDRNGELLFTIYKDENRSLIPLSQVPTHMIQATLAIEDKDFYHHFGFDVRGIVRATLSNAQGENVQGGSTITQQLVKNTLLTPEKTLRRKVRELILAVIVDGSFSKDEILEMYFNEIPYGGATYGVEQAAQRYFGKSARDLTLGESAYLAGLPQAPSTFSPFGPSPEMGYARQAEVLRRMVEDGYITAEQAAAARTEQLVFRSDTIDIKAPHFVFYVRDLLAQKYGEKALTQDGLTVRTTLDLTVQNNAQVAVTQEVERLKGLRVGNGAALVTNPKTGEVLGMVGSKNYWDFAQDGQVNVTIRPRQPGSSIKPLTYATAMEQGILNPTSLILDAPITYQIPGSKPYAPKNYDGKFHGNVTVRQSLASSYNIPAVKTLALIGVNSMIDKGQQLGIDTWNDRSRFGLSLTLGGGEVLMTDMAELYSSFATYGHSVELNPFLEITNANGEQLYYNTCALESDNCYDGRQLDPRVAYQITSILSDNQARSSAFGTQSLLNIPGQEVAVKTGTTNSLVDNWTIGYTTDRLVATWVGNNDSTPMSYVASGLTGASPIWNNIFRSLLSTESPHRFPTPEGMIKVSICKTTGTLSCQGCPVVAEELFIPGTEPKQACTPAYFKPKTSPSPKPPRDKILNGATL